MKLTKPQRAFLEGANECTPPDARAVRFGWSGIGARARGPQLRIARHLSRLKLVEYVDHGRAEDSDGDEIPIYAITAAGRAALT